MNPWPFSLEQTVRTIPPQLWTKCFFDHWLIGPIKASRIESLLWRERKRERDGISQNWPTLKHKNKRFLSKSFFGEKKLIYIFWGDDKVINTKFGPNKKILTKDFLFLGLEQKSKRKKNSFWKENRRPSKRSHRDQIWSIWFRRKFTQKSNALWSEETS